MKKALFIDRDGTIVREPSDEQVDSFAKLAFVPGAITALAEIARRTGYELVMVSNQDGLGTPSFPEDDFWPVHNFIIGTLRAEGVEFREQLIDRHFPGDGSPMRKPGIGMVAHYMDDPEYDMSQCYVIGDRETDRQLAVNMGCRALILSDGMDWPRIAEIVVAGARRASVRRTTAETDILVEVDLDGSGRADISTGIGFFDHMLQQIARHGMADLTVKAAGDLHVDQHHTMEDTALALGQCLRQAMGDKLGMERYGYSLPMDDCLCSAAVDFGGRPWLVWSADFHREMVGDMPTEMFLHFFKSLSDAAMANIHIEARGQNEHHKIEGIFKAFAKALRMAVRRDIRHMRLPSTKGAL